MTRFETTSFTSKKFIIALLFAVTSCCLFVSVTRAVPISNGHSPVIDQIYVNLYGDILLVSGHVSDIDSNMTGMIVEIGGDVSGTAIVHPSGNFIAEFEPPFGGVLFASAKTEDPEGNPSNIAYRYSSN